MNTIQEQQKIWEGHASSDPLWAILTDARHQGGRWKRADFFKTGSREIATLLAVLKRLGAAPKFKGRALDFGCGVGRLTQALGAKFKKTQGVDISQGMIALAKKYNRLKSKVQYHVNAAEGLPLFKDRSFDFIYASVVIQHIPPRSQRAYLRDFARVLKPGGLLVFNIPFARRVPFFKLLRYRLRLRTRVKAWAQKLGLLNDPHFDPHVIPMNPIPAATLRGLFESLDCEIVASLPVNSADASFYDGLKILKQSGEHEAYPSLLWVIKKS